MSGVFIFLYICDMKVYVVVAGGVPAVFRSKAKAENHMEDVIQVYLEDDLADYRVDCEEENMVPFLNYVRLHDEDEGDIEITLSECEF